MSANIYNPVTKTMTPYAGNTVTELAGMSDVSLAAPSDGQLLTYDSDSHAWTNANTSLDELTDTNLSSPSNGQVLKYNASTGKWVNGNESGGGGGGASALDDLTDVTISSATSGQVLKYNGSGWVNAAESSGGTSDYTDLTNKPSINNVTLSGNKTTSDLGISYNDLTNKPTIPNLSTCFQTTDPAASGVNDRDAYPVLSMVGENLAEKKSISWSMIKSALKTYFDTLYSDMTAGLGLAVSGKEMSIKPFASGDMDDVIPTLPSVGARYHKYSTSEQVVGEWIDGKKIYQKTIQTTIPTTTQNGDDVNEYVSIGASIETVVDIHTMMVATSGAHITIDGCCVQNSVDSTNNLLRNSRTLLMVNNNSTSSNKNSIRLINGYTNWSGYTLYVTIQYTKTT